MADLLFRVWAPRILIIEKWENTPRKGKGTNQSGKYPIILEPKV